MMMIWNNPSSPSNYSCNSNSPPAVNQHGRNNHRDIKARRALNNIMDWHTIFDRMFENRNIGAQSNDNNSSKANYAHVLSISSSDILQNKKDITVGSYCAPNNNNVCYWNMKYKVSSQQLALPILQQQQVDDHPNKKNDDNRHTNISLSTYMAVLDDVMSWAIEIGDEMEQRPSLFASLFRPSIGRPGFSVSFRTQWVNHNNSSNKKNILSLPSPATRANPLPPGEEVVVNGTTIDNNGHQKKSSNLNNQEQQRNNKNVNEEEDVLIHVSVSKVGRTLGFVNAEIYKTYSGSTPQLILTSSHVKYLPMGWVFDIVMHPLVFRMLRAISSFLPASFDKTKKNQKATISSSTTTASSPPSLLPLSNNNNNNNFSLKDMFDPTYLKIHNNNDNENRNVPEDDPSKEDKNMEEDQQQHPAGVLMATFTFDPIVHSNPMGALHGGCQAILMEIVATKFIQKNRPHLLLQRFAPKEQNNAAQVKRNGENKNPRDNNNNSSDNILQLQSSNNNGDCILQLQSITMDFQSAFVPSFSPSLSMLWLYLWPFKAQTNNNKNASNSNSLQQQDQQIQFYAKLISHIPNNSTIVRVQAISLKRKRLISQADLNFSIAPASIPI